MIAKQFKRVVEQLFGCRIYRGWFPRGMNLEFDLLRLLAKSSPVIVDVGANVGQTAIELASTFSGGAIHACEPIHGTFEMLLKNTSRYQQIVCHQVALGAATRDERMFLYEGTVNNSLKPVCGKASRGEEQVSVLSLDDFCTKNSLDTIDYLKIDTEGFDLEVIKGAETAFRQKRIHIVLAELGFAESNSKHVPFADFLSAMQARDMSLFGIYDQRREFDQSQSLRRADCLFVSKARCFPGLSGAPDN